MKKINNLDVYVTWELNKDKTVEARTDIYNAANGTNYGERALNERYKNFKDGYLLGLEESSNERELEIIAKKELRVLMQQKKNTLLRRQVNKLASKTARESLIVDAIDRYNGVIETFHRIQSTISTPRIVDVVVADLQYKGDEQTWVNKMFNKLLDRVISYNKATVPTEFRFTFLGDDVEAAHGHSESQRASNNTDTVTQVMQVSELYTLGINAMNAEIDKSKHKSSLVFVPYSNHGLIGGKGKERYQNPMEDVGRWIFRHLETNVDNNIFIYPPDRDTFTVQTKDTVYLHGHQGYRNSKRFYEVVGVDKDIFMGHLHHYEAVQERNRVLYLFDTCRKTLVDYERMMGVNPTPMVSIVMRQAGRTIVERIEI